jgi:hypothetical protein
LLFFFLHLFFLFCIVIIFVSFSSPVSFFFLDYFFFIATLSPFTNLILSPLFLSPGNVAFFAAYAQTKVILANRERNRKLDAEIRQKNSELLGENHGFLQGGKTDFRTGIQSEKGKEIKLTDTLELKDNRGREIDMKGVKNKKAGKDDRNRMKKGMRINGCDSDKVTDGKHTAVYMSNRNSNSNSNSNESVNTDARGRDSSSSSSSINTQTLPATATASGREHRGEQSNSGKGVLLAGAMAGLAYVISSHPLEIASILMQIDLPKRALALSLPLPLPLPFSSAAVMTALPSTSLSAPLLLSAKAMTSSINSASLLSGLPIPLPLSPVCSAFASSVRTVTSSVRHVVTRNSVFQSVFRSGPPLVYR